MKTKQKIDNRFEIKKPEVLLLSSYPPRECGIATYSQDLLTALSIKFQDSFSLSVCALETNQAKSVYPKEVKYKVNSSDPERFLQLANTINASESIAMVLIQHEFGLFQNQDLFLKFLFSVDKPVAIVFHTVLPHPTDSMKLAVRNMAAACSSIIVMTNDAAKILHDVYGISDQKTTVIPHGTHLIRHEDKELLKEKYGLQDKKVLSTFGLLSSGKGIETTIEALPEICAKNPDVIFLVIGKTHPEVVASQGEVYRDSLIAKIEELNVGKHVKFVNHYLPLSELLEYLQLTDIYLFTSLDPHQAVSGTFSYAMGCGCPIISTPIPQAMELLHDNRGIIVDFRNAEQLAAAVNKLISNDDLLAEFSTNILQGIVPSSWENSAILHARLFESVSSQSAQPPGRTYPTIERLIYTHPEINLEHLRKMTTEIGIIQFSKINQPDLESGYTLDDNARAMIALCMYYERTQDKRVLYDIYTYLSFIEFCQQPDGSFLNYVDCNEQFTDQNNETNLSDSNGRAIWALGYLISMEKSLPKQLGMEARAMLKKVMPKLQEFDSPRSIAFSIKGLYYSNLRIKNTETSATIKLLANRLVQWYDAIAEEDWNWFETYLTYANAVLPEALLCAWQDSGEINYKRIARESFDFLLSLTLKDEEIKVISNRSWLQKGGESELYGEQPIDVAYTILALNRFHEVFKDEKYHDKSKIAFDWFLGKNHLSQIIYNPSTGGCFDGLEQTQVNLNQGAESTLSYLISRLVIEQPDQLLKKVIYGFRSTSFVSKADELYTFRIPNLHQRIAR